MPSLFNIISSGVLSDNLTFGRAFNGTDAILDSQTAAVPLSTSYRRLGNFTLAVAESGTFATGLYINLKNIKPTSTLTLFLSSNGGTSSTNEYVLSSIPALSTYSESFYIGLMFDPIKFNAVGTTLVINVSARTSELSGAFYIGTAPAATTPTVGGVFNKALISTATLPISSTLVLTNADTINVISHLYSKQSTTYGELSGSGSSNVVKISGARCSAKTTIECHGDSSIEVVNIQGGSLDSSSANILQFNNSSSFIAGTYSSPLTSNFTVVLSGVGGRNITLNHSSNFVVVGDDKLNYTYLLEDTLPNISSISLTNFNDNLSQWAVGDTIYFPPNGKLNAKGVATENHNEVTNGLRKIVSKNNNAIQLNSKIPASKLSLSTSIYGPDFRGAPVINLNKKITFGPFIDNTYLDAMLYAKDSSKVYIKNAEICRTNISTIGEVIFENNVFRGTSTGSNQYTTFIDTAKALNVTWKNNISFSVTTPIFSNTEQTAKGVIKNLTIDGNIFMVTGSHPINVGNSWGNPNKSEIGLTITNNTFCSTYVLPLINTSSYISTFRNNISYYVLGGGISLVTKPNESPAYIQNYKAYKILNTAFNTHYPYGIRYCPVNWADAAQASTSPAISCKDVSIVDSMDWAVYTGSQSFFGIIDGLTARDCNKGVYIKTTEGPVNIANAFIMRNNKTSKATTSSIDGLSPTIHTSTNLVYDVKDCEFTHSIRNSIVGSSEDAYAITLNNSNFLDKLKIDYCDLYSSKINLFLCPLGYPNHKSLVRGNILCSNTNFYYPKTFTFASEVNYIPETDGGSVAFDGENYIKPLSGSHFNFGSGDFTIDGWVNATDTTVLPIIFDTRTLTPSKTGFAFGLDRSWFLQIKIGDNSYKSNKGIFAGLWYHIALSKTSGVYTMWVNGEKVGSFNDSTAFNSEEATLGASFEGENIFTGNIFNFRVIKGESIYDINQNFNPPSYPVSSTNNTSLLLGAYKHNQVVDRLGKNEVISYSTAMSSRKESKFGTSSIYFDGANYGALGFRKSDNFSFGTSNFTIEGWLSSGKTFESVDVEVPADDGTVSTTTVVSEVTASSRCIFDTRTSGSSTSGFYLAEHDGGFIVGNDDTTFISTESGRESGKWQHFAVVRDGSKLTLFIDGLSSNGGSFDLTTENFSDSNLTVGGYVDNLLNPYTLFGYLDNFLVIKDEAKYTRDFSPSPLLLNDIDSSFAGLNKSKLVDNSVNNALITPSLPVNTIVRSASPKSDSVDLYNESLHYGGLYFDSGATQTSIEIPYKPELFDWWSSDFTLEYFIYPTTFNEIATIADTYFTALGTNRKASLVIGNFLKDGTEFVWSFGHLADGTVSFVYQTNNQSTPTPRRFTGNGKLKPYEWNHVALCVTSGNPRIYVNGQGTLLPFSEPYYGASFVRGSSQSISITGSNVLGFEDTDWTVEAWVNLNTMPPGDTWPTNFNGTFVLIGVGTPAKTDGFDCIIGQTKLLIHSNDVAYVSPLTHNMNPNTWYHIAYTRSGDNINFYVNGKSIGSVPFSGTMGTATNTYIGTETQNGAYFDGLISNLRVVGDISIYNGNFTPSTVKLTTTGNGNAVGNNILTPTEDQVYLLTLQDSTFIDNSMWDEQLTIPAAAANKPTIFTPPVNYPPVSNSSIPLTIGQHNNTKIADGTIISNLRIVKGTALYSGDTINVPTSALINVANTSLLLKATNGGIIDGSGNTSLLLDGSTTAIRNLVIDTSKTTYGTNVPIKNTKAYAVYNRIVDAKGSDINTIADIGVEFISPFNGSNSYNVSTHGASIGFNASQRLQSDSEAINFGTGDFVIDFYIYPTQITDYTIFQSLTSDTAATTTGGFALIFNSAATLGAGLVTSSNGGAVTTIKYFNSNTPATFIPLTTWTHLALTRTGNTIKLYKNGTPAISSVSLTNESFSNTTFRIGNNITGNRQFRGYISNFRIRKGVGDEVISPANIPTTPLPNTTECDLLINTFYPDPIVQSTYSPLTSNIVYFDGNSFINVYQERPSIKIGPTDPLTIQMWVKFDDITNQRTLIDTRSNLADSSKFILEKNAAHKIALRYTTPATRNIVSNSVVSTNIWYHIAVVIDEQKTVSLYINGLLESSGIDGTQDLLETFPFKIGAAVDGTTIFKGHISNLRITKKAEYSGNFIPPTEDILDVNSDTLFLLNHRTDSQKYYAVDKKENTTFRMINCVGGVSGRYTNNGGIWFNKGQLATSDYISAYDFGTSSIVVPANTPKKQFSFELWFYPTESSTTNRILVQKTGPEILISLTNNIISIEYYNGRTSTSVNAGNIIVNLATTNNVVNINSWNHIAFTCDGNTYRGYLNGKMTGSDTRNLVTPSKTIISFGSHTTPVIANQFVGYMDDIRITKDVARYTGNTYTVPSAPFDLNSDPNAANVVMLVKSENAKSYRINDIIDSSNNNNPIIGGSGVSQIKSTPVNPNGWCVYFDGTDNSKITIPANNAYKFDTLEFTVELWFYKFKSKYYPTPLNCLIDYTTNLGDGLKIGLSGANLMISGLPSSNKTLSNFGEYIEDAWNHVAVVNTGAVLKVFLNGEQKNGDIDVQTSSYTQDSFVIGANRATTTTEEFCGLISNLRVIKGTPLYITNFTPNKNELPATVPSDLDPIKAKLLLNGDTTSITNGDVILDLSNKNLTLTKMLTVYKSDSNPFGGGESDVVSKPFNTTEHQTDVFREKGIVNSYIGGNPKKHGKYLNSGTIITDDTVFRNVAVGFSEKLTPNSNKTRLRSSSRLVALRAYNQMGNFAPDTLSKISVWVRKSSDWSGQAPRLIVVENKSMGVFEDTVLATATQANDTWIKLEATNIGSVKKTGMLEFYVDCVGVNVGSIWIDDWAQEII